MTLIPELLAPAGSLEKLYVAVYYGADAVYLSGQRFGLRAAAANFSAAEMEAGAAFAKKHGVKVYVTANIFFHDEDLEGLGEYCACLEQIGIDGVIVSDLGAIAEIQKSSNLPLHLSTQTSCLNPEAAMFWKDLGVSRIIVGRELSIKQAVEIKEAAGLAVEMFVHGAMCMSYSGHCVISNFTAGRDSNRGGCNQSCRYSYKQCRNVGGTEEKAAVSQSRFISSMDMNGIRQLPEFAAAGIDCLKIEGRMKSPLYIAATTSAYRRGLDAIKGGSFSGAIAAGLDLDLRSIPHRGYAPAYFTEPPPDDSLYDPEGGDSTDGQHQFAGLVLDCSQDNLTIRANAVVERGARMEFLAFDGQIASQQLSEIFDKDGCPLLKTRPGEIFHTPRSDDNRKISRFTVARTSRHAV